MNLVPYRLYHSHMVEVKRRFRAIDRILGAKEPITLTAEFDDEFMWLQLRQIVELVTYSAIAADKERYAAFRQDQSVDYRCDRKPGKILNHLPEISLRCLPKPLGATVSQADGTTHFEEGEGGCTAKELRDRFKNILDTAGQHLHAVNPFNEKTVIDQKERLVIARKRINMETEFLKRVLWKHVKFGSQFQPGESPRVPERPKQASIQQAWVVEFGAPGTDSVRIVLAESP
ncbi:hypothetical protein Veis_2161 [Verminephrobacter eiseniae EF01-2]|uniref:Uncharacterized protein n=1 Tax=Verminephrobacter eiseniae (strain EF01-2) TaxID=391735 RepID=A1WJV2_VEREI|nr:hypothetical protein Veis_2161 [Verminephrobacter eiseniae EF01-2]MCW5283516.1 hypothetical protein [Verminephrobacter eiseniae]MCW8178549.1 hypothetical protein [Verminephrobacter eiseniae]MCW8189167.1 hypothetical protein [Verminephrobacter eiseniae]